MFNFDDIRREHDRKRAEFERLCFDPCMMTPEVGDRVVVAAGPLGMGFDWVRLEATVIEAGQLSYKVRFTDRTHPITGEPITQWIHPAIITDVLRADEAAGGSDE